MKRADFERLQDRVDRFAAACMASGTIAAGDGPNVPGVALTMAKAIDAALESAGYVVDDDPPDVGNARVEFWPHCYNCRTRIRVGCVAAFSLRSVGRCPYDAEDKAGSETTAELQAEKDAARKRLWPVCDRCAGQDTCPHAFEIDSADGCALKKADQAEQAARNG